MLRSQPQTATKPGLSSKVGTRLAILVLLFALDIVPASAYTYSVGGDASCDFPTLDAALVAAGLNEIHGPSFDEIRVAMNAEYKGEHTVLNHSVSIRGGFSTCSSPAPTGKTRISALEDERALTIKETDGRFVSVVLSDVEIVGPGGGTLLEGGLVHAKGWLSLHILESVLSGGSATEGGGLFLTDGAYARLLDTTVTGNRASRGGGLACNGGFAVEVQGDSQIIDNEASVSGGGAFVTSCTLDMASRGTAAQPFLLANRAQEGGGIYADSDWALRLQQGIVGANRAQRGAGIFLSGRGLARLGMLSILANEATTFGGGFFLQDEAVLDMSRDNGLGPCSDTIGPFLCGAIAGNIAPEGGAGLFLQNRARASVSHVRFSENESRDGAVAFLGDDAELFSKSTALWQNVGDSMFFARDHAWLTAHFLTAADNHPWNEPLWVLQRNVGTRGSDVSKSIVYDEDGRTTVEEPNPLDRWSCLLIDAEEKTPPGAMTVLVEDPQWWDPASFDYRLKASSPAIDVCDNEDLFEPLDRRGLTRGLDYGPKPDLLGFNDLGAFVFDPEAEP